MGKIVIANLKGLATFYRAWNDSVIRNGDTVWNRYAYQADGLHYIDKIFKINGLNKFAKNKNIQLNPLLETDWTCCIICVGFNWKNKYPNSQYGFNLQKYNFNQVPVMYKSDEKCVFNAKNIIQCCYVAHDHIWADKQDHVGVAAKFTPWASIHQSNLPKKRANHDLLQINNDNCKLEYCGVGWCCNMHDEINCHICVRDDTNNSGSLHYECQENKWPFYKPYSVYQGYVCRFFNAHTINELNW